MIRPAARLVMIGLLVGCGPDQDASACYGVCGDGTRCDAGRCVVAAAPPVDDEPTAPEAKTKKRGRRRGSTAESDDTPTNEGSGYTPVADGHIPRYDATATTVLDPDAGSERLADVTVRSELRGLEPAFDRCIADAVKAGVTIPPGRVDFTFGLSAKGKVTGINAKAATALRDTGVIPCLRKTIFDHRFPTYDGPPMGVDYSFEVG